LIVSGVDGNAIVEIYNLTGQSVFKQSFENETKLTLNLASGMYLVNVSNDTKSITKKIIVK
jgi:GDP-D-mannose dehydratase